MDDLDKFVNKQSASNPEFAKEYARQERRQPNPRVGRYPQHRAAILQALAKGATTPTQIREAVGLSKGYVSDLLTRLMGEDSVWSPRRGVYWLTRQGREAVAHAPGHE